MAKQNYEKELLRAFMKASKTEDQLKSFLHVMLTPKEYKENIIRFEILSRLNKGETQRSIASDLGIGIATVTRGSHELGRGAKVFKKVIQ